MSSRRWSSRARWADRGGKPQQDVRLAACRAGNRRGRPALHDLRHAGNHFAAASGAALKDLMARMGHDSERAALIYQREERGADKRITDAIDSHVQAERDGQDDDDDGPAGALFPLASGTEAGSAVKRQRPGCGIIPLTWAFAMERVTRIEPALSAWELDRYAYLRC